jgi:hypothetical protein
MGSIYFAKNGQWSFSKSAGISLDKINHFEGSDIAPAEHHYSINKDGNSIGRAIVFDKDPKSIHEAGRIGPSLKDIRLNPEHQGQGHSKQVIDQLTAIHGPLSSDSRGNISAAGSKMFDAYGAKHKDSNGTSFHVLGGNDAK